MVRAKLLPTMKGFAIRCARRSSFFAAFVLLDVFAATGAVAADPLDLQVAPHPMNGGGGVQINEIRIDQPGVADPDEYFELSGPPGASLDGLSYIVLGDDPTGTIEAVVDLTGQVIPASGYFVAGEASLSLAVPNMITTLDFENSDVVTHMLVTDFSGMLGVNLDPDADGLLNNTPWSAIVDVIVILGQPGELPYGPGSTCMAGPSCQTVDPPGSPGHVFRCLDVIGQFFVGNFDAAAVPSTDSPGQPNRCSCGDGIVILEETCDDMGESATCDDDCSTVECSDGNVNVTAGEQCDDMGESAMCNDDCTPQVCGDGKLNTTAGEQCDDAGESATCNGDCSLAVCGDGTLNVTAGEECDGDGMGTGGETSDCDNDCTLAGCGDGLLNVAAGEACDGDGLGTGGETAACNIDCTAAACGDSVMNTAAGEECDEGGPTLTCTAACQWETCANGVIDPPEDCDEGGIDTPTCDADCTFVECGDGLTNFAAGEMCDAGMESIACNDDCTPVVCGDGKLNTTADEECDDMGESEICNDDCTLASCGDGVVNFAAGEACDDGNAVDGDNCTSTCQVPTSNPDPPVSVGGGGCGNSYACSLGNPQGLVWSVLTLLLFWGTDRPRRGAARGRTRR